MKKVLKIVLFLIIAGLGYSLGIAVYENNEADDKIKEFISRGEHVSSVLYEDFTYNFYEVKREHDYEFDDKNVIYNDNPSSFNIGAKGDVLLTRQSPFPYAPGVHQFVSYFFGGHTAIVSGDNRIIQSTGMASGGVLNPNIIFKTIGKQEVNGDDDIVAEEAPNYFFNTNYRNEDDHSYNAYNKFYRTEIITIRVKNISSEAIDQVIDEAHKLVDKALYNYLFFLDYKNKYYCTDLISRVYSKVNNRNDKRISLNDDGFITSANDIILSDDAYISLYWKVNLKLNEVGIYYLENMEG